MKAFQLGSPGFGEFESAEPSDDVDLARTFRMRSRVSNAASSECISVDVASKDSMRKECELIFRTDDESRRAATTATAEAANVMTQAIDTQLMNRRLIERHTRRQRHARECETASERRQPSSVRSVEGSCAPLGALLTLRPGRTTRPNRRAVACSPCDTRRSRRPLVDAEAEGRSGVKKTVVDDGDLCQSNGSLWGFPLMHTGQ